MIRLFLALALSSLLTACGSGGGDSAPAVPTPPAHTLEINADSLYAGLGIERSAVTQLKLLRPDLTIVDKAVVGLTLRGLMSGYTEPFTGAGTPSIGVQLPFAQVPRTSLYVIVELGGNDAYENMSAETYERLLRQAITILRSENRIPVLTGFGPVTVGAFGADTVKHVAELSALTHTVADSMGVLHLNLDQPETPEEAGLLDDHIHPTQQASDLKAARIAKAIP